MASGFHMIEGDGQTSYAKNSSFQEKAMFKTKEMLENATREVYMALLPQTMVIADLGCSSGPNTVLFISEVINVISDQHCSKLGHCPTELQFFLNDLPGNDFNHLFQLLQQFKNLVMTDHNRETLPLHYISGLPGSYQTRLFPCRTVHLFHSSFSLHWRSQTCLNNGNEGNIYIAKTTPSSVVKLYQEQFQKDFSLFLQLRSQELVFGGKMVLTFLGRKNDDVFTGEELNYPWEMLARALQSLVAEGLIEEEKLDSFSLPLYEPSMDEVKAAVMQSNLFDISHFQLFELNWDHEDDSEEGDVAVLDGCQSGVNDAKIVRAVTGPLLASHFGESILDRLFVVYACHVARDLKKEERKSTLIALTLERRR